MASMTKEGIHLVEPKGFNMHETLIHEALVDLVNTDRLYQSRYSRYGWLWLYAQTLANSNYRHFSPKSKDRDNLSQCFGGQ